MKIDLNKIGLLPDIYVYFILFGELYCQSNKMFAAINSFWYQDVSAFCLDTAQIIQSMYFLWSLVPPRFVEYGLSP